MTTERSLLLIADISGYTDYMRTHRMSLAHAEVNTARLLGRVVDAAPDFDLVEIEGDAVFMSRSGSSLPDDAAVGAVMAVASAMHRAFHLERQYVATNLCPCQGCAELGQLKLKFVAHIGEVATQTIRDRRKLVGIDVILVHRLLKNAVQVPEYVLLSEPLHELRGTALTAPGQVVLEDLEGIGPTRAYYVDVAEVAEPVVAPAPGFLDRVGMTLALAGAGLPSMLGLRRR